MPYEKIWSSTHPGCLIILLDQSASMAEPFSSTQAGARRRKCDIVATIINGILLDFIRINAAGSVVRSRADIAILGYGRNGVTTALSAPLNTKPFTTLPELYNTPMRVETRRKKEMDDTGDIIEVEEIIPIWIDSVADGTTPMLAALRRSEELAQEWAQAHPHNFPPVIVNITDGIATDVQNTENPIELVEAANLIRNIRTDDGSTLLFTCHITNGTNPPTEFPPDLDAVPNEPLAHHLFLLSSVIPDSAIASVRNAAKFALQSNARGYIFNGDAHSIRQMFMFASAPLLIATIQTDDDPILHSDTLYQAGHVEGDLADRRLVAYQRFVESLYTDDDEQIVRSYDTLLDDYPQVTIDQRNRYELAIIRNTAYGKLLQALQTRDDNTILAAYNPILESRLPERVRIEIANAGRRLDMYQAVIRALRQDDDDAITNAYDPALEQPWMKFTPSVKQRINLARTRTVAFQRFIEAVASGDDGQILRAYDPILQGYHKVTAPLRDQVEYSRERLNMYNALVHALNSGNDRAIAEAYDQMLLRGLSNLTLSPEQLRRVQYAIKKREDYYGFASIEDHEVDRDLRVGTYYVLAVGVQRGLAVGSHSVPLRLPTIGKIQLEITVYAEEMEIQPDWRQIYVFNGDDPSLPVLRFRIRPLKVGRKLVRIEFFHERHWLAKVELEFNVVAAAKLAEA